MRRTTVMPQSGCTPAMRFIVALLSSVTPIGLPRRLRGPWRALRYIGIGAPGGVRALGAAPHRDLPPRVSLTSERAGGGAHPATPRRAPRRGITTHTLSGL